VAQKGKNARGVASVHVEDPQHLRDPREAVRRQLDAAFSVVGENPRFAMDFPTRAAGEDLPKIALSRGAVLRIVSP
jgi:hypothetical protein